MQTRASGSDLVHALPFVTTLPHRAVDAPWIERTAFDGTICQWQQRAANPETKLPAGPRARVLYIHLISEALRGEDRIRSDLVSMYKWSHSLTKCSSGGRTYADLRQLLAHVAAVDLRLITPPGCSRGGVEHVLEWPLEVRPGDPVWDRVRGEFRNRFGALTIPLRRSAVLALSRNGLALDFYVWLASTLPAIHAPALVPWEHTWAWFGSSYRRLGHWKSSARLPLAMALAAYPQARLTLGDDGILLHPSAATIT
ncbi:plasmid encoded RepA protein [Sphingobium sp. BS19]|nr:plasmid encoded RepA protein [Sphingobium sp. BS19]